MSINVFAFIFQCRKNRKDAMFMTALITLQVSSGNVIYLVFGSLETASKSQNNM